MPGEKERDRVNDSGEAAEREPLSNGGPSEREARDSSGDSPPAPDTSEGANTSDSLETAEQSSEHPKKGKLWRRGFFRDPKTKRIRRWSGIFKRQTPTSFKRELTTIPNILCYIRIAAIPLILIFVDRDSRWHSFIAAMLFLLASVTDFFDGYLARKLNQTTILGKLLDPLSDKLIVSSVLITMVPMGRVPAWVVIVLLGREFAVTGLRSIAASEGMVIGAATLAKYKTAFQMISLFCLLLHYPYLIDYFGLFSFYINFHRVGIFFLYFSLILALVSGVQYFWKFAKAINRHYVE